MRSVSSTCSVSFHFENPSYKLPVSFGGVRPFGSETLIIAATALEHDLSLVTRNTDDFQWIEGLTLVNPFEE